jgi:hypothetical protein
VSVTIRSASRLTGHLGLHDTPVIAARSASESGAIVDVNPAGAVLLVVVAGGAVDDGGALGGGAPVVVELRTVVVTPSTVSARGLLPHAVTSTADATSP